MRYTFQPQKLVSLHKLCTDTGISYWWGSKPFFGGFPPSWKFSDCSGYSRWLVYHLANAIGLVVEWPEGSVEQHELCFNTLTPCDPSNGHHQDNVIRVAFLEPIYEDDNVTLKEAGHVMLLLNNFTYECYGHHGVGSREWGSEPFMHDCKLFILSSS